MSNSNTTTIPVPTVLVDKIKKRIEGTDFNSVSSYVTYVLKQILSATPEEKTKGTITEEDEKKVKERLRSLGYVE